MNRHRERLSSEECEEWRRADVNLLYTTIDDDIFNNREERISEWRKQRHIVELMPAERLENYLRFEISSTLALVDAIICEADTKIVSYNEDIGDYEGKYPLAKAVKLAEAVSSLPEHCAMRDGRKWKRIPFVIFANSLEDHSLMLYGESAAIVLPPAFNRYPSAALARIRNCVDEYYDRLFRDFQSMGMLIRFERGHAQVGPAMRKRDPDQESAYYSAKRDSRNNKGWLTVKRDNEGVTDDVEILQQLLDKDATEKQMQSFFEEHPALLMEALLGVPTSHRPNFLKPRNYKPDFALSPILGPWENATIELLELKGPAEQILTGRLHRGFTSKVHKAIDQVRDYDRYLHDPLNISRILQAFGYIPTRSKLAVLIGRDPDRADIQTLYQRRSEVDVKVVTYDMILQTQAGQIRGS